METRSNPLGMTLFCVYLVIYTSFVLINAIAPELMDVFGGRHSARSIHFICTSLLLLFFSVHLIQVAIAGFKNEIRAMITGKYILPKEE